MKLYNVLTRFKGTQDGYGDGQWFEVGQALLSDHLAEVALKAGFVKEAKPPKAKPVEPEPVKAAVEPLAEDRETKVEAPVETKPKKTFAKKKA